MPRFVAAYQRLAADIAQLPSQRQLGWLCDYFKVLPTDPRLADLTSEQINDLWLQLENLHPEQFKRRTTFVDADYEADEAAAISEGEGVLWEDTEVVEYSATVEPGRVVISDAPQAQSGPGDQWEDVPF